MKFPLPSTCNSPNFVGVEKSHVDAGVKGFSPPPAIVMKSLASKIGMPRVFKRNVADDLTFAPILISKPSLVVMVSDVSPLSTLTHPSLGMPAIAVTPSTFFSIPDVSLGIRELGSVVVVVVEGGTVVVVTATVVVVVVGATVVVVGATVVEVVDDVDDVGIVISMVRVREALCDESLPALSVTTAVTDHVPSVRVANSHVVATAVSYVQVMVVAPFTAVIVTMSPACTPETPTAGVSSDVVLSVDDDPVSDAASRSGIEGLLGAVVSMTMLRAVDAPEALF